MTHGQSYGDMTHGRVSNDSWALLHETGLMDSLSHESWALLQRFSHGSWALLRRHDSWAPQS